MTTYFNTLLNFLVNCIELHHFQLILLLFLFYWMDSVLFYNILSPQFSNYMIFKYSLAVSISLFTTIMIWIFLATFHHQVLANGTGCPPGEGQSSAHNCRHLPIESVPSVKQSPTTPKSIALFDFTTCRLHSVTSSEFAVPPHCGQFRPGPRPARGWSA